MALELVELARPRPGAGEVLVRVALSGVNPTDVRAREGSPFDVAGERVVPGHDGAGEIVEVGDGVPAERIGERVWLPPRTVAPRAGNLGAVDRASRPRRPSRSPTGRRSSSARVSGIPALTAHRCLYADGPIEGARVLVQGGAGAVGHAAIELARFGGARVAATVSSPEKAALARAAGAELVVDYSAREPSSSACGRGRRAASSASSRWRSGPTSPSTPR